jgi:TPR repeat protein
MRALVVAWASAIVACASSPPPRPAPAVVASSSAAGASASAKPMDVSTVGACENVNETPDAVALAEKGCQGKDGQGCLALAKFLWCGVGVARDPVRATRVAEQACDAGVRVACARASAGHLEMGEIDRALPYAEKGCKAGDAHSCINLAGMLAQGPAADPPRAAQILTDLCDKGDAAACGNLGTFYWVGLGVAKDLPRAKSLAARGCDATVIDGCNTLGGIAAEDGPEGVKRAVPFFDRACSGGQAISCDNLGQALMGSAAGSPDNRERAAVAFQRACDMNFAKACTHLARLKSE